MQIVQNEKTIKAYEKKHWKAMRQTLAALRAPVVARAEHVDGERLKDIVRGLLDNETMQKALISLWGDVGSKFGADTEGRINALKSGTPDLEVKEDRKKYWRERSEELERRKGIDKAVAILDTEAEAINSIIDETVELMKYEGVSVDVARRRLMKELEGDTMTSMESYQAERIARTEVISACNTMSYSAASDSPGVLKTWMGSGLPGMRESHITYSSMPAQPMNYEYNSGLKFPGDPECSDAGEVVNCRCSIGYDVDTQYNG